MDQKISAMSYLRFKRFLRNTNFPNRATMVAPFANCSPNCKSAPAIVNSRDLIPDLVGVEWLFAKQIALQSFYLAQVKTVVSCLLIIQELNNDRDTMIVEAKRFATIGDVVQPVAYLSKKELGIVNTFLVVAIAKKLPRISADA